MHGLDNMKRLHWNDRVRDPEMKKKMKTKEYCLTK